MARPLSASAPTRPRTFRNSYPIAVAVQAGRFSGPPFFVQTFRVTVAGPLSKITILALWRSLAVGREADRSATSSSLPRRRESELDSSQVVFSVLSGVATDGLGGIWAGLAAAGGDAEH